LPKAHAKFIEKKELKVKLLSDPEHKVMEDFEVWQLKKLYGREYMGVVRSTFLINPKFEIAKEWRKFRVKGHVEEVYKTLTEMK
jgi:peroxiredoxin Q/BCP